MARVRTSPPSPQEGAAPAAPPKASANLPAPRPKTAGTAKRKRAIAAPPPPSHGGSLGQVMLLGGVATSVFAAVALASYDPQDVSLSVVGTGQTENLVGPVGSYLADALLQGFGYAAWAVVLVGAWCALRLAGRTRGGWISMLVGGATFALLAAALQLALAGVLDRAFQPGGLLGMAIAGALSERLGRVGASLVVGTGLLSAATVLFRINWQPLAARAVDRVQEGAPRAVRGVGALGAGAVRASLRAGGAGWGALRDRFFGGNAEEDGEEYEEEEIEEEEAPARPSVAQPVPAPLTRPSEVRAPEPRGADSRAADPRPADPRPAERRAEPTGALARRAPDAPARAARRVEPSAPVPPELPSVWSARQAPTPPPPPVVTGDPDRDVPTRVGARLLAEVEWENTGQIPAPVADPVSPARRPEASRPAVAPPEPVRPAASASHPPQASRQAEEPRPPRASPPPADPGTGSGLEWADPPPPADWVERATGARPAAQTRAPANEPVEPPSFARPSVAEPRSVAPEPVRARPTPPAPRPAEPAPPAWAPEDAAAENPAAPEIGRSKPRPRPSGDGVTVLPGNLKSGGAGDDGRAVRKTNAPFQLPPLSLLDDHPAIVAGTDEAVLHDMARRLTEALSQFDVEGRVTAIRPGPVITMFEYEPAPGVKLNRITGLTDNLKMALKAISVRIVAPIPGKGCVGIEIPNDRRQTVWARDVFASPDFKTVERTLPMILGKDTEGRPFITDLAKMPHLLVGGTTGSGKSVGVNSMLVSMLFMRTPAELRMILIDPKMLEFALYEDIPHLLHPVVTEPKFASAVLKWACTEMDERYKIMARWQTRHIDTYNQKVEKELEDWTPEKARAYAPKDWPDGELLPIPKKFPFIVIVIDELADLMMVASSDVEASIARIVAKARAAGIHLIVATQTPRRDVITGMIKANMPASLAYQVRSALDSRVILDQGGAETLLGKGDLLFLRPGTSDLVRVHGPFLSEDEVHRVADFLRAQGKPEYDLRISGVAEDGDEDIPEEEYDEKYDEAVEMAISKGKVSTSMLQRHLGIGYNRAANIIETMEREGVVGPADGAKPREVLVGQG